MSYPPPRTGRLRIAYVCFTHGVVVSLARVWQQMPPCCPVAAHPSEDRQIHTCRSCSDLLVFATGADRLRLRCEAIGETRWHSPAPAFQAPAGATTAAAFRFIS